MTAGSRAVGGAGVHGTMREVHRWHIKVRHAVGRAAGLGCFGGLKTSIDGRCADVCLERTYDRTTREQSRFVQGRYGYVLA